MIKRKRQWIFVADERVGRLLECSLTEPNDRCRVEPRDEIQNTLLPNSQKGKPPTSGVPGIGFANPDRGHDVMRDQFAAQLAAWLQKRIQEHAIEHLELFTPPEFLGALRKALPANLRGRLQEHGTNLSWMSASDLSQHPAIRRLVGAA